MQCYFPPEEAMGRVTLFRALHKRIQWEGAVAYPDSLGNFTRWRTVTERGRYVFIAGCRGDSTGITERWRWRLSKRDCYRIVTQMQHSQLENHA